MMDIMGSHAPFHRKSVFAFPECALLLNIIIRPASVQVPKLDRILSCCVSHGKLRLSVAASAQFIYLFSRSHAFKLKP